MSNVLVSLCFSGEMAKQMKVKKLKNLKTLDSKPGKPPPHHPPPPTKLVFSSWQHISSGSVSNGDSASVPPCVCCCAGVYTAYKPYLNRDEDIIKQLQKVGSSRAPRTSCPLSGPRLSSVPAVLALINSWNISILVRFSFFCAFPTLTHVRTRPVQNTA